ncbi:serine/threonine-protein kinase pakD-like [Aricia agestis]|uniref:serine/threonine-protein kinase pakD-like n=1 Tax=Aricia agestis TaxID=91739 RepID=UPI001C20556F|nr:serine/threonine-protein kinase pakD-like [Aricia agestis]XP_041983276.1 serine/threonine-protein kinase pakD-like [Aricia agestis]
MASQFKEGRGKRLLQMCGNDNNKENNNMNRTDDLVPTTSSIKPGIDVSDDTGTINDDLEQTLNSEYFSEDDDDSVKDPNYSSSSSSSTSSGSSRSSSRSSTVQHVIPPTSINDPEVLGDQNLRQSSPQYEEKNEVSESDQNIDLPIQQSVQENKDEEGVQDIQPPSQSVQESNEEITQNIRLPSQSAQENIDEEAAQNLTEMEDNSNVKKGRKRLARVDEWLSVKAKKLRNTVNLDLIIRNAIYGMKEKLTEAQTKSDLAYLIL